MNFRTFTLAGLHTLLVAIPLFGMTSENNLSTKIVADKLYKKSNQFILTSIDSSHFYANKVSEIAKELGDKEYLAKSYFLQGYLYLLEKETALGVKYLLRARLIYKQLGDLLQEQRLLDNVVNIAIENHVFSVGEYYSNKRLKMIERIDDFRIRSDIYSDLGYVYMNNGMLTRSKEYFSKAKLEMEKHQNLSDTVFYSKVLTAMGVVNRRISEKTSDTSKKALLLTKAKELYSHALKVNASLINQIKINNNLGYLLLSSEDPELAIIYFRKALEMPNVNSDRVRLPALNNLGQFYFLSGNYDSAFFHFSKAIEINTTEKDYTIDQYDRSISINLFSIDELKKSLKYLDKIHQLAPRLTLQNQENIYNYLNLQIERIETLKLIEVNEMLEEVNADIRKEKKLANSDITFADYIIYFIAILSLLALIWVSLKLRSVYLANQKRIEHNQNIIEEIRKSSSKE
ncbi:MAG: hypothetical protein WBA74_21515 [Cyclobacteriaceae bacterium]